MSSYTIKEVAEVLGWKRTRIDKMISRKEFVPENWSKAGIPGGRTWTVIDTIRLAIYGELPFMGEGMRLKVLSEISVDDLRDKYAVVEKLYGPLIDHKTPLIGGDVLVEQRRPDDVIKIVGSDEIGRLAKNPWASRIVLISLENVDRRIRRALNEIRPIDPPAEKKPANPRARRKSAVVRASA